MTRLAVLYHPDKGGTTEQMVRINKAYEEARKARIRSKVEAATETLDGEMAIRMTFQDREGVARSWSKFSETSGGVFAVT